MHRVSVPRLLGLFITVCAVLLPLATPAGAEVRWTGTTGYWDDGANWSSSPNPPAPSDDVVVGKSNAVVFLTNSVTVNSLIISNTAGGTAYLSFSNWDTTLTTVGDIFIRSNGVLTSTATNIIDNAMTSRVKIACANLSIAAGGKIDVTGRGYKGGDEAANGHGPGKGTTPAAAGHGGVGRYTGGGPVYGSETQPILVGSGGGGKAGVGQFGGAGGGAVYIEATGMVTVNGLIAADGMPSSSWSCGGGSAGSIYINCQTFAGTNGIIRARGGRFNHGAAYSGSGGRIAIVFNAGAQASLPRPTVLVSASDDSIGGGTSGYPDMQYLGSIYITDSSIMPLIVSGSGRLTGPFSSWSVPGDLVFSNAFLAIRNDSLSLSAGGNLTIWGGSYTGRIEIGVRSNLNFASVSVGGNLLITNNGSLVVHSGMGIMSDPGLTNCGALVAVTGNLDIATGSWICPGSQPTNGGSVRFVVNGNVSIGTPGAIVGPGTNGGFNANSLGYDGGMQNVAGFTNGYGPGRGLGDPSDGSGAGHGGNGANITGLSGDEYESAANPVYPGSGGGASATGAGGKGGGVVYIEATNGTVTVSGMITANGMNAWGTQAWQAGGGAGGTVNIRCRAFYGTNGLISADGGGGKSAHDASQSGGGGRIAITVDSAQQAGAPIPVVRYSTKDDPASYITRQSRIGTVYLSDVRLMPIIVTGSGRYSGFTAWSPASVVFSNAWAMFEPGFILTPPGDMTIFGGAPVAGLSYTGRVEFGFRSNENYATLSCQNLIVTTGGVLVVYAGLGMMTNAALTNCGAVVRVAGDMTVGPSGWVYPVTHPTNGGSVHFIVASNVTIASSSGFDASGWGYDGGMVAMDGYGPGGGVGTNQSYTSGGSYGGRAVGSATQPRQPYGSYSYPMLPGSGGGGGASGRGGHGGGLVWIEATNGTITVNGSILANGGQAGNLTAGGGSGGGVYLNCKVFGGASLVTAGVTNLVAVEGGHGRAAHTHSPAGGGGRIAIFVDSTAQAAAPRPTVQFETKPNPGSGYPWGGNGTLYVSDTRVLPLLVSGSSRLKGVSAWSVPNLTVTNAFLAIENDAIGLNVLTNLTVFNGTYTGRLDVGTSSNVGFTTVSVGGNMNLGYLATGSAAVTNPPTLFYVYSGLGLTDNPPLTNVGALVDVDGDILVASNSWIIPVSQPTNGGSVLFRVHGITLDVGGGFDANGCGWAGGPSPDGNGFGPGGGQGGGHGAGGGYGGRGGDDYATSKGGAPYGSSNAPVQPGSGGGASSPAVSAGGYGGGLVRIEAINIVTVNGLVSANGTTGNDAGGGSGGGVYVRCKRFGGAATGRVTANGGNAGDPVYGGAGAGGRIAIWYSQGYDYLGSYQAATGTATTTYGKVAASNGTIVVDWMRMAQGAIFILR